jgi:hypothetical protein
VAFGNRVQFFLVRHCSTMLEVNHWQNITHRILLKFIVISIDIVHFVKDFSASFETFPYSQWRTNAKNSSNYNYNVKIRFSSVFMGIPRRAPNPNSIPTPYLEPVQQKPANQLVGYRFAGCRPGLTFHTRRFLPVFVVSFRKKYIVIL